MRATLGFALGEAPVSEPVPMRLLAPPEDLTFLRNPISNAGLLHDVSQAGGIGWFLMLPAFGAGIAALVVRRRTATREVAEQIRLLIRAAIVVHSQRAIL